MQVINITTIFYNAIPLRGKNRQFLKCVDGIMMTNSCAQEVVAWISHSLIHRNKLHTTLLGARRPGKHANASPVNILEMKVRRLDKFSDYGMVF